MQSIIKLNYVSYSGWWWIKLFDSSIDPTAEQSTALFTKPLTEDKFNYFRDQILLSFGKQIP
jgi:hypothetical protein